MPQIITVWDYIFLPLYFLVIFFIVKNQRKKMNPDFIENKYFLSGFFYKLLGGLGVCFVYVYYYKTGGDTLWYFLSSKTLPSNLFKSPLSYLSILFGNLSMENFLTYGEDFKYILFTYDPDTFSVVRFTSLLTPVGLFLYLPTTIILASISYIGVWKLFRIFCKEFPEINRNIAIAILFVPSVTFWGSGILKDTYTLSASCWLLYSVYMVFVYKQKIIPNLFAIIIMSYILFSIRPYMLYIGFTSIILMLTHNYISSVKSAFLRFLTIIVIVVVLWGGGISAIVYIGSNSTGQYSSIDGMLKKASASQMDLSQSYYGENSFNIGNFEPTISGILEKAPIAINAGLYYPYIWKANNPVMLIAGIENLLILLLTFYVLILITVAIFNIGPKKMLKNLFLFLHQLSIFS